MSKIQATTFVICPVGTTIELYTNDRPKIGEILKIRHIDTKKVVQEARVESVEDKSTATPQPLKVFRVIARITK
jgi:hypothetical protein